MIKEIPKAIKNPKILEKSYAHRISKQEQVKKLGFTQKQSEQFQMLAENLDIIVYKTLKPKPHYIAFFDAFRGN
jgi:hypothetical protein